MKKAVFPLTFFIAALIAAFPLSAQEDAPFVREDPASFRETKIYVPPIDGIGSIEDMAYFFKHITGEITRQYRTLGRTRRTSDYVITGRLMPIAELTEEIEMPPDSEEDENILFIELFDNTSQDTIAVQYITYTIPDAATEEALSVIIYNLISGIPDLLEGLDFGDDWRNKILYLHASFLWTPRFYVGTSPGVHNSGIGGKIMVDYHPLSWLAVTTGAEISQDSIPLYQEPAEFIQDMILYIPLAAKFVFRPGESFMLEPYIGVQGNISLIGFTRPFPLAWLAGAQWGIKVGMAIVAIDVCFSMDVGRSYVMDEASDFYGYTYNRYSLNIGIGAKLGFFNRLRH